MAKLHTPSAPAPIPGEEPKPLGQEQEQDERAKATAEAMKIVATPAATEDRTVPDVLRMHRELFHEKGLDWVWQQLDDASGNEASKPEPPPAGNGEVTEPAAQAKPADVQPISNP